MPTGISACLSPVHCSDSFPAGMHVGGFILLFVSVRSCSGRQGNPADRLLLTFLLWLLLNGFLREKQQKCISLQLSILANHLLTWTLFPWERWCCYHPTATSPPPATSHLHPQRHPCVSKCHSCNSVKQDWPLQQLFLCPSPPFPPSQITWAPLSTQTCYCFLHWAHCRQQDVYLQLQGQFNYLYCFSSPKQ